MRYLFEMAEDKVADLLAAATTLSLAERRRLVAELDALAEHEIAETMAGPDPLAALITLAGTVHSDFDDISASKYAHVAAAITDSDG